MLSKLEQGGLCGQNKARTSRYRMERLETGGKEPMRICAREPLQTIRGSGTRQCHRPIAK